MLKIAAICDNDTAMGLGLAGVKDCFIPKDDDVIKIWTQVSETDDIGMVFISEKYVEALGNYLKDYRLRNNVPIIVEIPDKSGRIDGHVDFVSHLIKKAVGIEVKK